MIYYKNECKGGIEKKCPEDNHLASWGLSSDDKWWSWGTLFISKPHTNNGLFFLLTLDYRNFYTLKVVLLTICLWFSLDPLPGRLKAYHNKLGGTICGSMTDLLGIYR